jgi:hypothetical protein
MANNELAALLARRNQVSNKTLDPYIGALMREFGVADALTGVDYEVFDNQGKLVYRVRRKPLASGQIVELISILQKTTPKGKTRR